MSAGEMTLRAILALVGFLVVPPLMVVGERAAIFALSGPEHASIVSTLRTHWAATIALVTRHATVPEGAMRPLLDVMPWVPSLAWLAVCAVLPIGPGLAAAEVPVSLVVLAAAVAIASAAPIMGGLASGGRAAYLGAVRSAAQNLTLGVPALLALSSFAVAAGSTSLDGIANAWRWWWPLWQLGAAVVLALSGDVLLGRAPFDAPGSVDELGGDRCAAVTGMRLLGHRVSETTGFTVLVLVLATLWLGGWSGPAPQVLGWFWLCLKSAVVLLALVWASRGRARVRTRDLRRLARRLLLPIAVLQLALTATVVVYQ